MRLFRRGNYVHPVYGECCSRSPRSMPVVFRPLAEYNRRRAQGVAHDDEYRERMASLQEQFNRWSVETLPRHRDV